MGIPPPMFGDSSGKGVIPRNKRRQRVLYQGCSIPVPPVDYAHLQRVLNELIVRLNTLEKRGFGRSPGAHYLRDSIADIRRKLR